MNPFAAYGDRTGARRGRRPAPPPEDRTEKAALSAQYRRQKQVWLDRALSGPEGPRVRAMLAWVRTLGPDDADELVAVVAGEDWLLAAPAEVRLAALHLLGEEIGRIRRHAGLPELDDPLPGEPDTAFLILRRLLTP